MNNSYRFSADLNACESQDIIMVKLGFFWHTIKGFFEFLRYLQLIKKANLKAVEQGLLYKTEYFLYSQNHAGFIQYWSSFEALETWACKGSEHTTWWKEMETKNKGKDISAYHEVYIVNKNKIETIYTLPEAMQAKKDELPGLASIFPHVSPAKARARERFIDLEKKEN